MEVSWSEQAWAAAAPVYEKILELPIVRGLADGSLSAERFRYYVRQDALYLKGYARRLSLLAARLPQRRQQLDFGRFASEGVAAEEALHRFFLDGGTPPSEEEMSPTCLLYTAVLDAQLLHETEVAVAAQLPCFRVYRRVGEAILRGARLDGNPYRRWIETYGDETFAASARRAVEIGDELAADASEGVRRRMTDAFVLSTRLEGLFWESAWRLERWIL